MRAPEGRAFTRTGQQKINRDLQKAAGILSRRTVEMPKPPKPVVAGGGGAQGFTRARAMGVSYFSGRWNFYNWDIDKGWSNFADTAPDIFSIESTPVMHLLAPGQAGWLWQKVRFATDSPASRLTVTLNT